MPRKAKISRDQVLEAALAQLDAGGAESLSMRALGKSLGVEAMSLYKYVGKKDELLTQLREQLFGQIPVPESSSSDETWRRDLTQLCVATWRTLSARPSARALLTTDAKGISWSASSLPIGEAMMRCLIHPIPQVLDRAYAFHALVSFVMGQALFGAPTSIQWSEQSADDYPEIARAAETLDARNPEVEFELGLRALLDSIEQRSAF